MRLRTKALAGSVAVLLVGTAFSLSLTARAATVDWTTATNDTDATDVSTDGTLVAAEAFRLNDSNSPTVNGVTFSGFDFRPWAGITPPRPAVVVGPFSIASAGIGFSEITGLTPGPTSYDQLLFNEMGPGTLGRTMELTISGLSAGVTYSFEVWGQGGITATAGNSVTLNANGPGSGQFTSGTFKADASNEIIDFTGDVGAGISGFQLRIAAGTPAPSFYWLGNTNGSWAATNWASDAAGTPIMSIPVAADVTFSANGAANQGATTLNQDFTIHSLTISDTKPVVISSGTGGTHTLTIAGDAGTGIAVEAGAKLTINANVTLGGSSDTIAVMGTSTAKIAGILGGSNGLIKSGAGTLVLSNGGNNYSGATTISGGKIMLGAANALPIGTSLEDDATLDLAGFSQQVAGLSGTGTVIDSGAAATLTVNTASLSSFAGTLTGANLSLTKTGADTLVLSGTNTYTGATTVNAGTLQIGNGLAGNLAAASAVTVANNATLVTDLADGATFAAKVKLNGSTATLAAQQTGTNTLSGIISGVGVFNQNGTGTTILTAAETYTGTTNVNAGTLEVDGTLAAGNTVNVATAGTLTGKGKINGNATLTGDGVIQFTSTGGIAGTLGVTGGNWNGLGTVTGLVTSSSGDFAINGSLTAPAGLAVTGGTLSGSGTLTGKLTYTSCAYSTFDGVIAGSASTLTLNNPAATLVLTGTNTYAGATNVTAGNLEVDGSLAAGSTVNIGTAGALTGWGTIHGKATLTGNGVVDLCTNGDIAGTLGVTGGYWLGGGTVGGAVTSSSGTFTIGYYGNLTATSGLAVTGGTLAGCGILTGNLNYSSNASSVFDGTITGNSTVTINSSGTLPLPTPGSAHPIANLTLTGFNNYTGATTVNRGGLEVDGLLANTTVTVNSGGLLEGNALICGPVTINSGGTLAPGGEYDPGVMLTGPLTLKNGSTVDYRLGAAGATSLGVSDLTVVNGNLILGGKLNITAEFGFGAGTYPLFDYTGSLGLGSILSLGTLPAGFTAANFTLQATGNQVELVVTGGPLVQYWNGSTTTANGVINGGSGTWDNVSTNWTDSTGTANATWGQSVAVFSAGCGTVNINAGNITVPSMGFVPGSGAYTFVVGTDNTLTINGVGITNNSCVAQHFVTAATSATSAEFGTIAFTNSATAGNAIITNCGGAIANTYGGQTHFSNTATAGNAKIINQGATVSGANGSQTTFDNTSTAGSATLINNGGIGDGAFGNSSGGGTFFLSNADGGTARAITNGNGFVDISGLTDAGMKIGSIEGCGFFYLGSKTLTVGGNNFCTTVSGVIADGGYFHGTKGSLVKAGTGTLTLTGDNTYTGTTTVSAGTLQVGDGNSGSLASTSAVTIAANATLTLNLADGSTFSNKVTNNGHLVADDSPTSNYTISSVISGSGNLTKTGANTVTVTGANTYSGGTAVNGGALVVTNATTSSTGTGAVTVNNGGTLGGSGKITGATTLNCGGTIAPGVALPGVAGTTLRATSLMWNGGGTLQLQLGAVGDELVLTGALTKGSAGAYTVDILDIPGGITGSSYTLATFASTTFAATNFTLELPANYTGHLVETSKSLILDIDSVSIQKPVHSEGAELTVTGDSGGTSTQTIASDASFSLTPTPEPGSALLLSFGGAALLGWRRRRQK